MKENSGFSTQAIHAGEDKHHYAGSVVTPVFMTSTYIHTSSDDTQNMKYIRLSNSPNHDVLNKKIAILEGAPSAIVAASGMAAITSTILSIFDEPGGQLLSQNNIYGTAYYFFTQDFKKMGHTTHFCDFTKRGDWDQWVTPNTKAIYVESLSNPLLEMQDLKEIVSFAKKYGLLTIIDNTFLSPTNFKPYPMGFDFVIHSATKYLNGHSDLVEGTIACNETWMKKIQLKMKHFGGVLDPHPCFLLNRGIKTLALRMEKHNQNSLLLAEYLSKHSKIERVYHPGLPEHKNHNLAKDLFKGYGGMVCFDIKGDASDADRFMSKLQLAMTAPSLGGVESLVTRPAFTSHVGISKQEREKIGIKDNFVRFSTGVEDINDLIKDFEQALK